MEAAPSKSGTARVPLHVAIIMDGNGRWAKSRRLPRTAGHRRGADAVKRCVRAAGELGISYLTLFGFSSENWKRPAAEVEDLMALLRRYLRSEIVELRENGVNIRVIGERTTLPPDIVALIDNAEFQTHDNSALYLTVALNYGGRQELTSAVQDISRAVAAGTLDAAAIDEDTIEHHLATAGIPDPDLLIRTSGEQRLSNFLLWQLAYTELVFMEVLWPDFGKDQLEHAVRVFQQRERRYGAAGA